MWDGISLKTTGTTVITQVFTIGTPQMVSIRQAWPTSTWTSGAVVNISRWSYADGTLTIEFTSNTTQVFNISLDVLYI